MKPLRIALTKGRLEKTTIELLEKIGYNCDEVKNKGRRLILPVGNNDFFIDNADRVNSVVNHLLGAVLVDDVNVPNTQLIVQYLTLLGDSFGYNNTYGISLMWQSANTRSIQYYLET